MALFIFVYFPLFLFSAGLIFHFTTKKYVSPYHFIIKFGKPGCGKSTDMVRQALHYQKLGWLVYSNTFINVPGVRLFDTNDFGDWVEENSVILIDELNLYFDNRSFKTFSKKRLEYTRLYRHNKVIIIGYSQTFDCDKKLRDICDEMYLMYKFARVFTVQRKVRKVLTIRQAEYSQDADSQVVDNLEFAGLFSGGLPKILYMPKYFSYFDSYSRPNVVKYLDYTTVPAPSPALSELENMEELL